MAAKVKKVKRVVLPKETPIITAERRTVLGRRVKALRRSGVLPANLYGKKIASIAVEIPLDRFKKVFSQTGETGLVGLAIDGDTYPVLIHNAQTDPVTDDLLHADFFNVDLAEKVIAMVPLEFVGEAPIEKSEEGIIVHQINEIEVEALPTELPEKLEVDVSSLDSLESVIKITDIKIPGGVEIKEDPEAYVVSVSEPSKEKEVVTPAEGEEGAAVEGETPAKGEAGEGAAPAPEGAQVPAEQPQEEKKE